MLSACLVKYFLHKDLAFQFTVFFLLHSSAMKSIGDITFPYLNFLLIINKDNFSLYTFIELLCFIMLISLVGTKNMLARQNV